MRLKPLASAVFMIKYHSLNNELDDDVRLREFERTERRTKSLY